MIREERLQCRIKKAQRTKIDTTIICWDSKHLIFWDSVENVTRNGAVSFQLIEKLPDAFLLQIKVKDDEPAAVFVDQS